MGSFENSQHITTQTTKIPAQVKANVLIPSYIFTNILFNLVPISTISPIAQLCSSTELYHAH